MNKKPTSLLSKIFSNKIFLIILSFVISFTIWISINMGDYAETSYVVGNIPITINLPEESVNQGLEVFNSEGLKGSVTVRGNRSLIGGLTEKDIQIVPEQTDSLTSAGSYTLSLVARKVSNNDNYSIESVSPSAVYIKLDRNRTITQKVEQNINYKIPKGYYGTVLLNEDTVSISGPETEIKQIDKVVIEGTIGDEITSSVTDNYSVKLLDSFGEELANSDSFKISPSTIKATVSVLQMKDVKVNVKARNGPVGVNLEDYYVVDPKTVSIAGETNNIKNVKFVNTDPINFSELKNGNYELNKNIEIPSKCIDINSVNSVTVKLDLTSMAKKKLTINNFNIEGLNPEYSGNVTTSSIAITVYGTEDAIKDLSADDINAYVDLSSSEISAGSREVPVNLNFINKTGCWVYGNYNVVVDISES